jgi:hypothetical protein
VRVEHHLDPVRLVFQLPSHRLTSSPKKSGQAETP